MYKMYTHNDLDALGCAVLASLAFKGDIDIEYCKSPEDLSERLLKAYKNKSIFTYNLVYITDCSIPLNSEVLPYVQKHNNIRLFDHHTTALPLNEFKWANVSEEFNGKMTCGTELFYNYLRTKNLISERPFFVEQVRRWDTFDWKKTDSLIPKYLDTLTGVLGLSKFVESFTEKLKNKDVNELNIFNQYERDLIEYETNKEEKYVYQKTKQAQLITMDDDKKYVLSFADKTQSILGNCLCEQTPDAECTIMFNMNTSHVSIRSLEGKDISSIGKLYNGGGHKNSSGGTISPEVMKQIISILLKAIGNVKDVQLLNEF